VGPCPSLLTYLSLDQALLQTGWCVASGSLWCGGTLRTDSRWPLPRRLAFLRDEVVQLVRRYNVQHVVYESVYVARRQVGWETLLQVEAVLSLLFYDLQLPVLTLSAHPTHRLSWRHILNLGKTTKADVLHWAQAYCPVQNEHEADAFCLLWAALELSRRKEDRQSVETLGKKG
jgi:Holliday junction resolvasome RuvABC endonuclease subunit